MCICACFSTFILPLSKALQNPHLDILQCVEQVSDITVILNNYRRNGNDDFHNIFVKAENLLGESLTFPRTVGRQTLRSNYETNDPETFYRQSIYTPYFIENRSTLIALLKFLKPYTATQWRN